VKPLEQKPEPQADLLDPKNLSVRLRHVERREWWLWASALLVTLLLTLALASFLAGRTRVARSGVVNTAASKYGFQFQEKILDWILEP
jgi:hypothetical protein